LERARAVGADVLATGHYARVRDLGGRRRLLRGADSAKDQSYVLWMLTQEHLSQCTFPVGELRKPETRAIAEELGLRTARKPDSQEICFVRGGDFDAYVDEQLDDVARPGPILTRSGEVVGRHRGIGRYTVGQRKGLGIALGEPVYVTSIDASSNALLVGARSELAVSGFVADEASFVNEAPHEDAEVLVQHRAHGEVHPATVGRYRGGVFEVRYRNPVEAVAPGQSAALYRAGDPDELLGGGLISETLSAVSVA
jgi:tRNA-specific 2-thiouridylase